MQAILCTQCQSQNHQYTKFCLTCGAAITIPAARPITSPPPPNKSSNSHAHTNAESTNSANVVTEPATKQQEGGTWLSSLKKFWIF
jgi:hypothetical protein